MNLKNFKKILLLAGLLPIGSLAFGETLDSTFKLPEDANRITVDQPAIFGLRNSSAAVGTNGALTLTANNADQAGTTGRQWFTGKAVFEDVLLATAAATTYVVCFDSAATTNTNINDTGFNMLYPPMFANTTQAARAFGTATSGSGPPPPLAIRNGIYCIANAALRYFPVWKEAY